MWLTILVNAAGLLEHRVRMSAIAVKLEILGWWNIQEYASDGGVVFTVWMVFIWEEWTFRT